MSKQTKKFHNQSTHSYTWFILASEHLTKEGAKKRAVRERNDGNDARVVSTGKDKFAVYIHRNLKRETY